MVFFLFHYIYYIEYTCFSSLSYQYAKETRACRVQPFIVSQRPRLLFLQVEVECTNDGVRVVNGKRADVGHLLDLLGSFGMLVPIHLRKAKRLVDGDGLTGA